MLIGRKKEQALLHNAYRSDSSEFIAVYGRRRIGKTFLVNETFDNHFTFKHTGLANNDKKAQIKDFCESLRKSGLKKVGAHGFKYPSDWLDAFYLLEELIDTDISEKKLIFIDELSWMDTKKSGFITALESFWNGWASARKDIVLIVCASSTSWMLSNIIHNKGGLYNRLTNEIKLEPFTLSECSEYIADRKIIMNIYQIIECYMIMGGIPYYWSLLEKGYSLAQNIDRIFFFKNAPLRDEYKYMYQALFRNPDKYLKLMESLNKKKAGMDRATLLQNAGMSDSGDISNKLADLENCGFIKRYTDFGKQTRDSLYKLADNFTIFYFKFMANKPTDEHFWENRADAASVNAWRGLAFERVCLEHIPQIKNALGISGVSTDVHAWICKEDAGKGLSGSQIDLLLVRRDRIINLCEIKFSSNEYTVTKETDVDIRRKISDFQTATGTKYAIHPTLITPYGIIRNTYSDNIQAVITAEDLFER